MPARLVPKICILYNCGGHNALNKSMLIFKCPCIVGKKNEYLNKKNEYLNKPIEYLDKKNEYLNKKNE
jgi:hypothetical protein